MLARQRTVSRTVYGIPEQLEIWCCGDNAIASITIRQARVLLVRPLEKGEIKKLHSAMVGSERSG
jgi:hypothetical protein